MPLNEKQATRLALQKLTRAVTWHLNNMGASNRLIAAEESARRFLRRTRKRRPTPQEPQT